MAGESSAMGLFERDLAGAETLDAALVVAQQERALVVDAVDDAVVAAAAFVESDGLAAEDVVTVPEIGEGREVPRRGTGKVRFTGLCDHRSRFQALTPGVRRTAPPDMIGMRSG